MVDQIYGIYINYYKIENKNDRIPQIFNLRSAERCLER
jgi:hypothetical protein